jgi:hypothetical protein
MSKDPAILFYTSDFLAQCTSLTMEERGEYITLLSLQHQRGHLDQKTLNLQFSSSGISKDVLNLFNRDENNCLYSEWLEEIIIKRKAFTESRRKNRLGKTKK